MSDLRELTSSDVRTVDLNAVQVIASYQAQVEEVLIDGKRTFIKTLIGIDPFGNKVQSNTSRLPFQFEPDTIVHNGKEIKCFRLAWESTRSYAESVDPVTGETTKKPWCTGFDIIANNKNDEKDVIAHMLSKGYYLVKGKNNSLYNQAEKVMKFNPVSRDRDIRKEHQDDMPI